MPERHRIAAPASGAPLASPQVGARVRVPLDSPPTQRWSRALAAQLTSGLTGHPAVGHLKLDALVQGSDIILEGVEPAEAELLGPVLRDAIERANGVCDKADAPPRPPLSMEPKQAAAVARTVDEGAQPPPPA